VPVNNALLFFCAFPFPINAQPLRYMRGEAPVYREACCVMPEDQTRIADLLTLAVRGDGQGQPASSHVPLSELVAALGARSFGIVLVLFGLPNLLPVPGLPMVCGVVIGVVAYQMVQGREMLDLPDWLGKRRVKRADLIHIIAKTQPGLSVLEQVMHPRHALLSGRGGQRLAGAALLLLAFALMAPIPFFGGIAPGIAVTVLGLAWSARDGVFLLAGYGATFLAIGFTGALTYAIFRQIALFMLSVTGLG
jgi:hypothetical protein